MSVVKISIFHRVPGNKYWTRNRENKPKTMTEARMLGNMIKSIHKLEVKIIETIENEEIL